MTTHFDSGTNDLLVSQHGDVLRVSFNRPERRNALTPGTFASIGRIMDQVATSDIRVVMLTGEGGAFCAGGDVKGMHEGHQSQTSARGDVGGLEEMQRGVIAGMRHLRQPVVSAIPGPVAGAGLSIALATDLRIASPAALITTAFARVGVSGDFGTSWFLPRLIGEAKAKELMFLSPRLNAEQALRLGIVNEILDDDDFDAAALAWCHDLASRAPLALSHMKANLNRALQSTLEEGLAGEAAAMVATMASQDHREAAAAFVEKREPRFRGH